MPNTANCRITTAYVRQKWKAADSFLLLRQLSTVSLGHPGAFTRNVSFICFSFKLFKILVSGNVFRFVLFAIVCWKKCKLILKPHSYCNVDNTSWALHNNIDHCGRGGEGKEFWLTRCGDRSYRGSYIGRLHPVQPNTKHCVHMCYKKNYVFKKRILCVQNPTGPAA